MTLVLLSKIIVYLKVEILGSTSSSISSSTSATSTTSATSASATSTSATSTTVKLCASWSNKRV